MLDFLTSNGARALCILALLAAGCGAGAGIASEETAPSEARDVQNEERPESGEIATFGAGCFWCVEAVLEQLDGVVSVTSGYMGGTVENPTYKQVCTGTTGHAEVVQVAYDPSRTSYGELLTWFWRLHDPTTLNRQGNDVGTQYRSAIFYHTEAQREAAEASKKALAEAGVFNDPIVTEITAAGRFYGAEDYHQDYYRQNRRQSYCRFVIAPKLGKLGLQK
jgi:peptide-methionine (S)-S-oxide reductase